MHEAKIVKRIQKEYTGKVGICMAGKVCLNDPSMPNLEQPV
jgi:hypothetical protein